LISLLQNVLSNAVANSTSRQPPPPPHHYQQQQHHAPHTQQSASLHYQQQQQQQPSLYLSHNEDKENIAHHMPSGLKALQNTNPQWIQKLLQANAEQKQHKQQQQSQQNEHVNSSATNVMPKNNGINVDEDGCMSIVDVDVDDLSKCDVDYGDRIFTSSNLPNLPLPLPIGYVVRWKLDTESIGIVEVHSVLKMKADTLQRFYQHHCKCRHACCKMHNTGKRSSMIKCSKEKVYVAYDVQSHELNTTHPHEKCDIPCKVAVLTLYVPSLEKLSRLCIT
jgi:hypothetical protein